ncbi:AmmeMemoRadiSam system protein B [Desulfosarcina ovata]|uniref:MEMO1 family protein DSCOOX_43860 n=1 Tax=Desulfosarcina ovata subsp. ovata TaxID=2752305 RepID=A0A5K8AFB1_9BACT|nr:AmmeMemoRadiSam system protein B [Desulfosarcina ovata]BBO91206.1 MEMO1 family protein [Desulfosarcina ovata subsp. ovata]
MFTHRDLFFVIGWFCLGWVMLLPAIAGAGVREPAWAGSFYPKTRLELSRQLDRLLTRAGLAEKSGHPRRGLRALIMPHAGYAYSGLTAAHAAAAIQRDAFDRVILMGPDHRVGFSNAALTEASHWRTPLGDVPVGSHTLRQRWPALFTTIPASDRREHSLEVILPFLQVRLSTFELIPVVMGPCDANRMARAIASLINGPRTLLVISADLSHYLPDDAAVKRDHATLDRILALDPDWLSDQENRTCGRYPIGVLLTLARERHWRPELLHYANSGDTAGTKDAVVGYAAVAFYGEETMQTQSESRPLLDSRQGVALVTLARQTLLRHFNDPIDATDEQILASLLDDAALKAKSGTFVTLKIDNQLRGCIGSLSARGSIVDGVRDNALNAAFHDPRFPPLSRKELDQVHIEVSVLTDPVPLDYSDGDDLLVKLRPGIDGVIIRRGYASATFLPQVWEQLPRPDQFLSNLCMKAGLPAGQWRQGDLEVQTYQVQYFEETR